jgi:hypothetical protein
MNFFMTGQEMMTFKNKLVYPCICLSIIEKWGICLICLHCATAMTLLQLVDLTIRNLSTKICWYITVFISKKNSQNLSKFTPFASFYSDPAYGRECLFILIYTVQFIFVLCINDCVLLNVIFTVLPVIYWPLRL